MGGISSNKPIISWSIVTEPKNNSGVFTIEVADEEDTTFTNVLYSVEVSYVINV